MPWDQPKNADTTITQNLVAKQTHTKNLVARNYGMTKSNLIYSLKLLMRFAQSNSNLPSIL